MKRAAILMLGLSGLWVEAWATNDIDVMAKRGREVERSAVAVVGRVTEVWVKDGRYDGFHASLSKSVAGVPSLDEFKRDQQWVTVVGSKSNVAPGIFKGWGGVDMGLKMGDIVEMSVGKRDPKEYGQLGRVVKVLCRTGDEAYEECAKKNPLRMTNASGGEIKVEPTYE